MGPSRRYANAHAVLGDELFASVQRANCLVVGAGGIGCELVKNMVMTGFGSAPEGHITLLDLDTIDLSNLNRQFLFNKTHVKRPKAIVARETALKFNPNVNITALHRNIKDAEFNVDWFKSFDFVLNALDNLDARRHVNKMCLAADIALIESGTAGYVGQVQPIKKDVSECFDCTIHAVPKTFAVCTIRSTPSTAHHCIAWAKSYLFPQLFGADDEADGQDLDEAERNGENAAEIQELRKEAAAIKLLRAGLMEEGAARLVFEKVYMQDVARLLLMEDLWKHRQPPHALSYDALTGPDTSELVAESSVAAAGIKDQKALTLRDSFELFMSSVDRLSKRISPESPLSFDKDDDDTLDFVTAAANLRASVFDIESQTRFQVKAYAGNIIPAIATTNAIVAGVLIHQALNILRNTWSRARLVWLTPRSDKFFSVSPLAPPNTQCSMCRVLYLPLSLSANITLGELVEGLVVGQLGWDGQVTVQEGSRILWETEDFEGNKDKKLSELGISEGTFLTVLDDDDPHVPVSFSISTPLPADSTELYVLGTPIPSTIPLKVAPPLPPVDSDDETTSSALNKKRSADDAELAAPPAKKAKESTTIVLDGDDDTIDLT